MEVTNLSNIPSELKQLPQWVNWKLKEVNGRKTKIPVTPSGNAAATDNPATWSTFDDVVSAANRHDGIGFVFSQYDPYCGIDYDHVKNGTWDTEILNEILSYKSYAELSPSGDGAHVIVIGEVPGDKHRKGCREMYDSLRFFTVTGNQIEGTPNTVNVAQKVLNDVYKKIDTSESEKQPRAVEQNNTCLTDDEIISLCSHAKNSDKFESLWAGSTAGYDSHSDADLALISVLAFYTQDEIQLDRIFSMSGLYRHKWDRADYRERTISKALSGLTETYKPGGGTQKAKPTVEISALETVIKNPLQIASAIQEASPIWYDSSRNYWLWSNTTKKYSRVDETDIMCQIAKCVNVTDLYKAKVKNEILESIKLTGRSRDVQPTPINWIQFNNVVVDIISGKEFVPTPDHFFAARIPHNIGDDEDTPIIDQLFESWGGKARKQMLYEICAYCMYDDYPIHRIFCLVGVGRNGKGQFMTLIRRFIGLENCTSTDLDRLSNTQFEASKLYKKKAAFVGETDHSTLNKTSILKALSGGDLVSCEFKRADAFDFKNTAKIIIASNSLPPTTDRTEGFYRRWMIVEFNGRFKEGKDIIDTIPEWEYENLCRKCIRLLKDLLQRGTFDGEGSIEERMKAYEKKSNPVTTFIDDCCILDSTAYCPTWYLYEKYQEFQAIGGHRKLTEREFSIQLKNIGYEIEQKSYTPEMAARFGKGSNSDEDKRRNWRTVMGIDYKTTDESVALVALVEDISLRNSHIQKLTRNGATCATCATTEENAPIVASICKFVDDYSRKFNKVVTKRDVVGLSIEYCNKNGYHDIPSVADVIRKHLGIYVTEGYGEAENNGNGSLSGV